MESMILPIEGADYYVRVIPFPVPVPAFIMANEDATASVYINANLPRERQIEGYFHELWHLIHDDLYSERSAAEIELEMRKRGV